MIETSKGLNEGPRLVGQNHWILSAVEVAEQKTMCGDCGYRKWSTVTAFASRLSRVIIESRLIDLK